MSTKAAIVRRSHLTPEEPNRLEDDPASWRWIKAGSESHTHPVRLSRRPLKRLRREPAAARCSNSKSACTTAAGATFDESLEGVVRVAMVATGVIQKVHPAAAA
jgi:hypothetical protein